MCGHLGSVWGRTGGLLGGANEPTQSLLRGWGWRLPGRPARDRAWCVPGRLTPDSMANAQARALPPFPHALPERWAILSVLVFKSKEYVLAQSPDVGKASMSKILI